MSESQDQGAAESGPFNPAKYLVNLNGRGEYLEVKWRLVWLRDKHPEALIETELIRLGDHEAVFKATITIPNGGSATGFGSETAGDFRDFLEKAETKAIGRACAALGFGTQFSQDHEISGGTVTVGTSRVVDQPTQTKAATPAKPTPPKETEAEVVARMEDAIADTAMPIAKRVAAVEWLTKRATVQPRVEEIQRACEAAGLLTDTKILAAIDKATDRLATEG